MIYLYRRDQGRNLLVGVMRGILKGIPNFKEFVSMNATIPSLICGVPY